MAALDTSGFLNQAYSLSIIVDPRWCDNGQLEA